MITTSVDAGARAYWSRIFELAYLAHYTPFLGSLDSNTLIDGLEMSFSRFYEGEGKVRPLPYCTELEGRYSVGTHRRLFLHSYGGSGKIDEHLDDAQYASQLPSMIKTRLAALAQQQAYIAIKAFTDSVTTVVDRADGSNNPMTNIITAAQDGVITIPAPAGFAAIDLGLNKSRLVKLVGRHQFTNVTNDIDGGQDRIPSNWIAMTSADKWSLIDLDDSITANFVQNIYKGFDSPGLVKFSNYGMLEIAPSTEKGANPLDHDAVIVNDSGTDYIIRYITAYTNDCIQRAYNEKRALMVDRVTADTILKVNTKVKYGAMRMFGSKIVRLGLKYTLDDYPMHTDYLNDLPRYSSMAEYNSVLAGKRRAKNKVPSIDPNSIPLDKGAGSTAFDVPTR